MLDQEQSFFRSGRLTCRLVDRLYVQGKTASASLLCVRLPECRILTPCVAPPVLGRQQLIIRDSGMAVPFTAALLCLCLLLGSSAAQPAADQPSSALQRLTEFRQQHRKTIDGRLCAAAFVQDNQTYTDCTDARSPDGTSGIHSGKHTSQPHPSLITRQGMVLRGSAAPWQGSKRLELLCPSRELQ